ncbi:MAG: MoxR family ATPase [Hyphomicrobiaceae bacterium]|nr:MoxR family ATPase [Hyphomicrobiaceae bacterium]
MTVYDQILDLKARMQRSIIGQEEVVERLIIGLLADGNLLVEGLPGLAKTRAIKSLAANLAADFSRIQFTPDLLPADVTGTEIYYSAGGKGQFRFQPGPIFGNIILADEINRAPAKVQAALLEAMEERQVTVAGTTHKMPDLFMVMATQNPIEQEGTYPLPEAQMDRFLMHVMIGYGTEEAEGQIIRLVRGESSPVKSTKKKKETPVSQKAIFDARKEIAKIHSTEAIETYIVDLVFATRFPERYSDELAGWIEVGASPRGAIGLDKCARVHAWLRGNDYVSPDDIRAIVHNVLRHRLIPSYEANADGITPDHIIKEIVAKVAVP